MREREEREREREREREGGGGVKFKQGNIWRDENERSNSNIMKANTDVE